MSMLRAVITAAVVLPCMGTALAQPAPDRPQPAAPEPDTPIDTEADAEADTAPDPEADPERAALRAELDDLRGQARALAQESQALRQEQRALEQELALAAEDLAYIDERVRELMPVKSRLGGYLDFGFFHAAGTGAGHRADFGNAVFPEYGNISGTWVFMGDPLSTAVNARGEPASTGDSRALQFDGIGARSAFLVNALHVDLFAGLGKDLVLTAGFDLVPRGRDFVDPDGLFFGDFVDIKLAYLEYRKSLERVELSLYAGKLDSVLGYEYRVQEAPARVTVTPSLVCRYVCGHPLGLKARLGLFDGRLVANVAMTNGSHFWEGFAFADELDINKAKTVAARFSYAPDLFGADELEIGVSGAIGAQDGQARDGVLQHHIGVDARLAWGDVELVAEYVRGDADGATDPNASDPAPCDEAPCLDYQAAYGLASFRASNRYIPFVRVDWRDALHQSGKQFVYISELVRATGGLRVELGAYVIIKAEYTLNRELGRIPSIPNDVFTSALIVRY